MFQHIKLAFTKFYRDELVFTEERTNQNFKSVVLDFSIPTATKPTRYSYFAAAVSIVPPVVEHIGCAYYVIDLHRIVQWEYDIDCTQCDELLHNSFTFCYCRECHATSQCVMQPHATFKCVTQ